jgi:hypothetical protein
MDSKQLSMSQPSGRKLAAALSSGRLTRREMLALAGTSIAATSILSLPPFLSSAAAQFVEPSKDQVQLIQPDHFLAKVGLAAAAGFPMGSQTLRLDLDVKAGILGGVMEVPLTPEEQKITGRKSSVLEGTAIPIANGSASMAEIRKFLAANNAPKSVVESSKHTVVTTRRRDTTAADRLDLNKQFPVVEQVTMLHGLALNDRKQLFQYLIPPTFTAPKSKKKIRPGITFVPIPVKDVAPAPVPPPAPPPEQTPEEKDFLGCFSTALATFSGIASPLTGTTCAACAAALVALPATAGFDAVIAIPTCWVCLFCILGPAAAAFAVCADQL